MNSFVEVHKCPKGILSIPQLKKGVVNYKQLGHLIREGYAIKVVDGDKIDFTKETLMRIAFEGILPAKTSNEIISFLSEAIDDDRLYLIIENGGIVDYVARKARGAVNE